MKMNVQSLSPAHCILLAVHLASESNINALHSFTPARSDALDPELIFRILLTYLPEALDPSEYTSYISEVGSRLYLDYDRKDVDVSVVAVQDLTDEVAQKRAKKLELLQIEPPDFPPHAPKDILTRFLCHRVRRIDEETGLITSVPKLIAPFLGRNDFIRSWYISVVLPILRLDCEYYPEDEPLNVTLNQFESLNGKEGVDFLLKRALAHGERLDITPNGSSGSLLGRDVKGLVGPWMYGHSERKRRKLDKGAEEDDVKGVSTKVRKISLSGVTPSDKTGHDWEYLYQWMVQHSTDKFELISRAIDDWDGPSDIDLGGFDRGGILYLDEDIQSKLELQYAQAAFATCYAATSDTEQTVRSAHGVLARLAELLDFIPPPDLATSVASLPKIERHAATLDDSQSVADIAAESLLRPEHPLTTPRFETYMLLQMMVYSAYQFSGLGYSFSLANVAKLHFYASAVEQLEVLRKILSGLVKSGARKDDSRWVADRAKLLWLWNWGIDPDDSDEDTFRGSGTLGKIHKQHFEEELLKVFTETSCYQLAISIYLEQHNTLSELDVERIILSKAMEAYDGASNGNKTRGGVKKASDMINAFRPHLGNTAQVKQASALIAATHALSFYSLTLQHGVPFQPVSIRVSQDPISLINKVLEQNPGSYTQLDDLISIAQNLVSAGLTWDDDSSDGMEDSPEISSKQQRDVEHRVTFMAIEAALREDDFETAYSYIVNRIKISGADVEAPSERAKRHEKRASQMRATPDDNDSWRAAFLAGRYRPSNASPPTLRRLEQRTELLSHALLLAPVSALTDILAAWRRCEEEMMALQLSQQQEEDEFDDQADKRLSSGLPGNFIVAGEQPELILNQKRREMGRLAGSGGRGETTAPLSMFDLTRNAARAFSKNAFPLHQTAARSSEERERGMQDSVASFGSDDDDGQARVRRRDVVANAVSGSLASGLGWVLGATPVHQQQQQGQH